MLIGVISDTHRCVWSIENAVKKVENADLLIHLGDNVQDVKEVERYYKGRIVYIKGNCDYIFNVPSERIEEVEGKRIFITHGHRYNVKNDLQALIYKAMEVEADIVLYGHTHVSKVSFENGIWLINPGSPSLSRDGFNSVALVEISDGKVNASIKAV